MRCALFEARIRNSAWHLGTLSRFADMLLRSVHRLRRRFVAPRASARLVNWLYGRLGQPRRGAPARHPRHGISRLRIPTALITGSGRGLGKELARQYAANGWEVIGTTRRELEMKNLRQIREFAARLNGKPIDLLFCNAGILGKQEVKLGSLDFNSWEEILRVNLLGPAALAESLVDNVAGSERRIIAMMSSRVGSITESTGTTLPYATSKAALNMLVKGLAAQLQDRRIIVVALHPGWVRTDMSGGQGRFSPQTAVHNLREVISGLGDSDSGKFISYDGSEIPW